MNNLAVLFELRLQGLLILLAIRPMARAVCAKRNIRAERTTRFHGDVRKPLRNAQSRLLGQAIVLSDLS
jgi:hypothetical protein